MSAKSAQLRFPKGIDLLSADTVVPAGFARSLVNVDVTNSGALRRRSGHQLVLPRPGAHSIWAPIGWDRGYYVQDSVLYSFNGLTDTEIYAGLTPGFPVSYTELAGDVYWSNGVQSGVLIGGVRNEHWGPDEQTGPLGQTYLHSPKGSVVRSYRGRIYLADDSVLWATEPMDYMRVDSVRGFLRFESQILLMEPVSNGIYIGTRGEGVRFLTGADYTEFQLVSADHLTPVKGSGLGVDGSIFDSSGQGAIWFTERGWVFGDGAGATRRLTDKQLSLPVYESAASVMRESEGMRQILSFARGGSEGASLSDTLTSEVIRNGVLIV